MFDLFPFKAVLTIQEDLVLLCILICIHPCSLVILSKLTYVFSPFIDIAPIRWFRKTFQIEYGSYD